MKNSIATREEWLTIAAGQCEVLFTELEHYIPEYKVTCGFPSRSAVSKTKTRLGECWAAERSDGNNFEVFISPLMDDPEQVVAVLIHEMVHVVVGTKAGHGGPFKKVALAIGLEGKMASTTAGEKLTEWIKGIIDGLGPYPHHKLVPTHKEPKPQKGRMLKAECTVCKAEGEPYIVRMSGETMKKGLPYCPIHGCQLVTDEVIDEVETEIETEEPEKEEEKEEE